jgi:enoyl-CoA hydratase/carnithine racemase
MSDAVLLSVEDSVATLTLNRPDQMNILTPVASERMQEHLDALERRDDIRCVVVEGTGGAFCVGGDIERIKRHHDSGTPPHEIVEELEQGANEVIARLVGSSYPTVAKVDGPAVGAGANLAIGCDIVLASESASIGFGFNRIGLSVDTGTSYLLPRIVGVNKATELVFTGEVLDARQAEDIGLFNHVYSDDKFEAEVTGMVNRIASGPTVALGQSKRLIQDGFEKSLRRALCDEAAAQGITLSTDDHYEGLEAFLDDRDPEFEGE